MTRWMIQTLVGVYLVAAQLSSSGFRFVVHKGMEGLGDRLQQLLMVVQYASVTQRTLVIDWRDAQWSEDPSLGFDSLFEVRGVKYFHTSDFAQLWTQLRGHVRVVPEAWTYRLEFPHSLEVYKSIFRICTKTSSAIAEIAAYERPDFQEEVVVYAGVGLRSYSSTFIRHFRFNSHLMWYFKREIQERGLPPSYVAVHIRGADKTWRCEDVTTAHNINQCVWSKPGTNAHCDRVRSSWGDADAYLADLASKLEKMLPTDMPVLLVSDSACLTQRWKDHGFAGELAPRLEVHDAERARVLGTLWDFVLMVRATHLVCDGHSHMSRMAQSIAHESHGNWLKFPDALANEIQSS